ncbi:MAG: hypothetical protein OXN20_05265 [Gemmatimonadota bacterium]|nr:hypothetical protein [Gemmatimonadota bacterium]
MSFFNYMKGALIPTVVSRDPVLLLWYHREEEFDLEKMFPDKPEMALLNDLLDKCIVQYEQNCLENAGSLLKEIDSLLNALRLGADPIRNSERSCKVCGFGKYQLIADRDINNTSNFGLGARNTFKIFVCNNCGHVQLFYCMGGDDPPGWTGSTN